MNRTLRALSVAAAVAAAATLTAGVPAFADQPTTCTLDGSAHRAACVYYDDEVARFTAPGATATGFFDLQLDGHSVEHGTDSDGGDTMAPEQVAVHGGQGFQSLVSKGVWTGVQSDVSYRPDAAPFTGADQVGYGIDIPQQGDNSYGSSGSTYLFTDQSILSSTRSGEYVTMANRFSDRPLSVGVTNAVPGLTLTQVGTETTGGQLTDPAGRTPGDTLASGGTAFFGGYRSGTSDATLQATYVVAPPPAGTDPTAPQAVYAGFRVQVDVQVDTDDPNRQLSTCTVQSATSMATLNCSVTQGGSNAGQSQVAISISAP